MYIAGVSGSTWAIAHYLASQPGFSQVGERQLLDESVATLKAAASEPFISIGHLSSLAETEHGQTVFSGLVGKLISGDSMSAVDFFGVLIGAKLLVRHQRQIEKQEKSQDGNAKQIEEKDQDGITKQTEKQESKQDNDTDTATESTVDEAKRMAASYPIGKLSSQKYLLDGRYPMPIYSAVRHLRLDAEFMPDTSSMTSRTTESASEADDTVSLGDRSSTNSDSKHYVRSSQGSVNASSETIQSHKDSEPEMPEQESVEMVFDTPALVSKDVSDDGQPNFSWYEFTPFEAGTEDNNAWVPVWGFGRRFKRGVSVERLPEQNFGYLLGLFGSAFCATAAHMYDEIRMTMPTGVRLYLDGVISAWQARSLHMIPPAMFPNPIQDG